MTRFARAKGSKSSNEKTPGDSTPWEVMKEQMLNAKKEESEAKARQAAEQQRIENYENFLKEHKKQKRKAVWCEFDDDTSTTNKQTTFSQAKRSKDSQIDKERNLPKDTTVTKLSNVGEVNQAVEEQKIQSKSNDKIEKFESEPKHKTKKKRPEVNIQVNEVNDNKQSKVTTDQISSPKKTQTNTAQSYDIKNKNDKNQKKKINNKFDGQPTRRKPITEQSIQLIINGKEVELVRFDGFPVTKKDAERLQELKQSMINKGIPKSEVQKTMKLERRRAEKALARMKKDVCYNCRKGGHNLSDCPDLKSKIPGAHLAEGVCFKCGSTEHRQFECKVQRDKEFRFATCFICKEQGHIARQCPDNPKGLYPNGGGCKICGDVTHLRKDCPSVNNKKEETTIKLQTLDNTDDLEDIGQKLNQNPSKEISKKPKKIKF